MTSWPSKRLIILGWFVRQPLLSWPSRAISSQTSSTCVGEAKRRWRSAIFTSFMGKCMFIFRISILHICLHTYIYIWIHLACLQDWAYLEGGKLLDLARHMVNITYRTVQARTSHYVIDIQSNYDPDQVKFCIYIEFGQNQNIFLMKQSLPPKKNIVNNHVAWKNSSCGLEKFFVNWVTQSHSLQESQNPGAETDHCQSPGAGSQLWCSVQTYVGVHRHHWHACGWFGGLLVCS